MNRTIKFRVYNKKTKSWIHGPDKDPGLDGVNLLGECILMGYLIGDTSIADLNEIETLQYSGLKDKNGRQIFEGDILKIPENEVGLSCVHKPYCHVWYSENSACWIISYNHLYSEVSDNLFNINYKYEVIGNIFDNPELIQ